MIKKDKIFELKIEEDDDLSGIDSISLVDEPAIEVNWIAFNKQKSQEFHIPDGEDRKYVDLLMQSAQNEEDILNDGFEISNIQILGNLGFISTDPNGPSIEDESTYKVRYKYILNPSISGPKTISTTRDFCKDLLAKNYVWRIEDMEKTTNDFGDSAMVWRGGYNCRHVWARIEYRKDATIINKASVNKGKVETGGFPTDIIPDTRVLGYEQPSTVTAKTLANPSPSTVRNLGLSKDKFEKVSIDYDDTLSTDRGKELAKKLLKEGKDVSIITRRQADQMDAVYNTAEQLGIPKDKVHATNGKMKWETIKKLGIERHIDNNSDELKSIAENLPNVKTEKFSWPLFEKKEDAEKYAEEVLGCSGSHEHKYGDVILYMPCEEHPEDMGYDVSNLPSYVDQLPKKKKKNEEYIKQFSYLFKENFQGYSDYPESVKNNAKAVLKWVEENGWGSCGTDVGKQRANQLAKGEAISEETIRRMYSYLSRHEVDLQSSKGYGDGCGKLMYDSWGGKTALSWAESKIKSIEREKMSKQRFQIDSEEKRIVLGPAMIPDLKIFRKDELGNPYYVFFTADTIRMIAEKYMRNKYIDNNDQMHDGKAVKDVYVIESWIKEDENDKSIKYGYEDLPVGTWFVAMKVKNNDIWNKVKEGKLNGFSVSGFFAEEAAFAREEAFLYELAKILKKY